jgi:general secretion pathway protein F
MTQRARNYRYSAYTQAGSLTEGHLQASSLDEAVEMLWRKGLTPFETLEDSAPASARWWRRDLLSPRKASPRDVASFTREFATLAQSGIAIDDALRIVTEQSGTGRMRLVVAGVLDLVLDGAHLSDAMAHHPEAFQDDYVSMVRAAEVSGDLAKVFGELADLLERRHELAGKVTSALVYPCVLIVLAVMAVSVVVGVLVPGLAPIFAQGGRPMPAMIAFIVSCEQSWQSIATAGVALAICLFATGVALSRSDAMRLAADRILLGIPLAGTLSAEQNLARFARTLGSLLRAGVPMLAAQTSAGSVVRNRHIAAGLAASLEIVRDGQSLSRALSGRPGVTPVTLRMIAVGEETGKLSQMLLRIAIILEQQSQRRIERLMTLLTPALTIAIAGLVGMLIFTVMNAILSVNELAVR